MGAVVEKGRVKTWGNSLAVRLPADAARAAGVAENTPVNITATPGRLVIEVPTRRMTLEERLARFDPVRHGGELLDLPRVGREL